MFYLIGIGLNENSITAEALKAIKSCKKVYLENYTVNFPYSIKQLEKNIKFKIIPLNREPVENENFINEAKKQNIALLIYGSPLVATTHISLLLKCKQEKIPYKIFHNASIFDAITETGLQIYKFGKITNITNHESESFFNIIEENQNIKSHTLILLDIGMKVSDALKKLQQTAEKKNFKLKDVIVCSRLGTRDAIIKYNSIENLIKSKKEFKLPACIIIPGELHFLEKEAVERLR